jgi:hypothetical protein
MMEVLHHLQVVIHLVAAVAVLWQLVLREHKDQALRVVARVVLEEDSLMLLELQVNLQVHFIIFLVVGEPDQEVVQLLLLRLEV